MTGRVRSQLFQPPTHKTENQCGEGRQPPSKDYDDNDDNAPFTRLYTRPMPQSPASQAHSGVLQRASQTLSPTQALGQPFVGGFVCVCVWSGFSQIGLMVSKVFSQKGRGWEEQQQQQQQQQQHTKLIGKMATHPPRTSAAWEPPRRRLWQARRYTRHTMTRRRRRRPCQ